jgi:serine/threonine-protein kinase
VQIASALATAHAAGIVHRDIKPENIMVREDGLVKVLDFGLVKLVREETPALDTEAQTKALRHTTPGAVLGTAGYMSPEQARGREVDERTDIWSLGVALYEVVTGHSPFAGATKSDCIASILKSEPPPLAHHKPDVPRELEHIVSKALRKDREERYQHIKDLLIDLIDLKQELEFEAKLERSVPPDTRSQRELRHTVATDAMPTGGASDIHTTSSAEYIVNEIKQHKLGATVALVALIGIIAIGFLASSRYVVGSDTAGIDSIAILPFTNATADPNTEYLSDGISESLINNLSQLPQLKVIARSSAFKYKGKEVDPQAVAGALGVDTILTGRVLQRGDSLQITVELMDVRDNTQVWGGEL